MAEAVGLASAVIAIVEITAQIASRCKAYIEHVKVARKELRMVLVETTSLQGIADNLQFLLDHDPDFEDAEMDAAREPISACLESLRHLESLVPALETDDGGQKSSKQRAKELVPRLAWPLNRAKVMSVLDNMQRYKATLSLAICGDIQ
jgi:hypothetical protein